MEGPLVWKFFLVLLFSLTLSLQALAGEVKVVKVKADQKGDKTWTFHVTLQHADTGWKHYADKWEILSEDGEVLGTRVLAHPHVNEQPFTRSLSGVALPKNTKRVIVRAHDKVHGFQGKDYLFSLPRVEK